MKNSENIQKADVRKTTSLVKKMLKEKFGIVASVRTEFASMTSSLNVKYKLGPDDDAVESLLCGLQYGNFNGMEDIYEINQNQKAVIYDGYQLEDYKFVFVRQEISNEFMKKLMTLSDAFLGDVEFKKDIEFHRLFKVRNFATQNEAEIENLEFVFNFEAQRIEFNYTVNGVKYNTSSLQPIDAPSAPSKSVEEARAGIADEVEKMVQMFAKMDIESKGEISESTKEIANVQGVNLEEKPGTVQLIDYSEKAFAVIGEGTRKIKDDLFAMGGKFNRNLKCGAGFIFSKKRLQEVTDFLSSKK